MSAPGSVVSQIEKRGQFLVLSIYKSNVYIHVPDIVKMVSWEDGAPILRIYLDGGGEETYVFHTFDDRDELLSIACGTG